MARLLLGSAPMRAWALLPLLASSGCLFLDSLNHDPTVTIAEQHHHDHTRARCSRSTPTATDPEDGATGVHVSFAVSARRRPAARSDCDYDGTAVGSNYEVTFYRTGIFEVTAARRGQASRAPTEERVMVTITDAPPLFSDKAMVVPTSTRNACDLNAAGDVVTLALMGERQRRRRRRSLAALRRHRDLALQLAHQRLARRRQARPHRARRRRLRRARPATAA